MAKKDLLKQAAGAHVRKTLGGDNSPEGESQDNTATAPQESNSTDSSQDVVTQPSEVRLEENVFKREPEKTENSSIQNSSSSEAREEKHLPKKNHLHRISSVMRLEDYTRPESPEREGSSRFLKIAGVILLALAIWFFWPAKHEIYMDIDKMTPEKVSGMSSQKEYHFSHGQDFFIYYKKGWSTPKRVRLSIYKTDGGKEEFSVQEKDFRKSFEKFQTYYDDTFFDQQGSYEVEIRDEDGELLVNKKFTID
ncbi:hypothetical protein A0128_18225 [Leptospira tipperaryensis]|uniref:Uncharacterized protein n=1 Tax=Leptospira tipperaryensis TaxID=2564040 RepID=A0A1D7V195_9LEPT|nr:hypothetical protein [Leptospira tipperaryensis]AOP35609.1 hypothetical protein A0128_18225 [Leptospira tipperaryensis]